MQKDYTAVVPEATGREETVFVEDYWTEIWRQQGSEGITPPQVEGTDEYRAMRPYLQRLPAGARILDDGCGLGQWTVYLSSQGYEAVGLDLSRSTITRLQERFPEAQFAAGDIRQTGFPDGHFDLYFSWGTFEHFEGGLTPCFAEAARILKRGGYLLVSVPYLNKRHLSRTQRPLWRWDPNYDREQGYRQPMRFYQWRLTPAELHREFEMTGFQCLETRPIHRKHGQCRMVQVDLGLGPNHRLLRGIAMRALYPWISATRVAHMLVGVGRKR